MCPWFPRPAENATWTLQLNGNKAYAEILVSHAMTYDGFILESWDVSAAFLQGFNFTEMTKMATELGVQLNTITRKAYIVPPQNVWFHLRNMGFISKQLDTFYLCLELLKAMYGLVDAPLLWQLCLRWYLIHHCKATQSAYDDNFYFWKQGNRLTAEMSTHIDDGCVAGLPEILEWLRKELEKRFGPMKRQTLPFNHVGVYYEMITINNQPTLKMGQQKFCNDIQLISIDPARKHHPSLPLTAAETTQLRAALGALLFLLITRGDLISEVVTLQTFINQAQIQHLKQANLIIGRAKQTPDRGLLFRKLTPPLRILSIGDSSFATSKTSYAIEGKLELITEDRPFDIKPGKLSVASTNNFLGVTAHILIMTAKKAKRISHSTSHAESLTAHNCLTDAETISMRFTEIFSQQKLNITDLIKYEDMAVYDLPIDHLTDCMDLVDLWTGQRGAPQDRSQRLIILSLREKRMIHKLRHLLHVDTKDMAANRLTKFDGKDYALLHLLDFGSLNFKQQATLRPRPQDRWHIYNEDDLHSTVS